MIGPEGYLAAFVRDLRAARIDRLAEFGALYCEDFGEFRNRLTATRRAADPTPYISAGLSVLRTEVLKPKDAIHLWQRLLEEGRFADAVEVFEAEPLGRRTTAEFWFSYTRALAGVGRIGDAVRAAQRAREVEESPEISRLYRELEELHQLEGRLDELTEWADFDRLLMRLMRLGLWERMLRVLRMSARAAARDRTGYGGYFTYSVYVLSLMAPDHVYGLMWSVRLIWRMPDDVADIDRFLAFARGDSDESSEILADGAPTASRAVRSLAALAYRAIGAVGASIERFGRLATDHVKDGGARSLAARTVSHDVLARTPMAYIRRSRRKIFDIFPFNNELEMLEMRLHEMGDWVDHFVIVESTVTFTNRPKALHFEKNKDRFSAFADKLIHVVVDQFPDYIQWPWPREFYQRDRALAGIVGLCAEDDLILNTDVDEVVFSDPVLAFQGEYASLAMERARYFLNYRQILERSQQRGLASVWKARYLRTMGLSYARFVLPFDKGRERLHDAGWHFSSVFDSGRIAEKMQNTSHEQYKHVDEPRITELLDRIRTDGPEPGWEICPIDHRFPAHVRRNQDRYLHLLA